MVRNWQSAEQADKSNTTLNMNLDTMAHHMGTQVAQISDGASNTMAVSEVLGFDSERDSRGAWIINTPVSSLFMAHDLPNSKGTDVTSVCDTTIPASHPLKCQQKRGKNDSIYAAARSRHSGGVNVTMADGSTHFFNDGIDINVWRALATRANAANEATPVIE